MNWAFIPLADRRLGLVPHSVDSEIGRLRTVLLHRPGVELLRLRPARNTSLLLDGAPWVARAQEEHDTFAERLRGYGVEVIYLTDLLADVLTVGEAREALSSALLADPRLGETLRGQVGRYLSYLDEGGMAGVLVGGLTHDELRAGSGLVYAMLDRSDFVIDPLPNLLFTRDSAVWIGDRVVIASPVEPDRRREAEIAGAIFRWHPRFLGTPLLYHPELEHLSAGDLVLLGRRVVAVGVGRYTTPAGVERLARALLQAAVAHTVLVVPVPPEHDGARLDTLCTVLDRDTVLLAPELAATLTAYQVTADAEGEPEVRAPRPFVTVAAEALGALQLGVLATGPELLGEQPYQWDDAGNALALAPGVCVAYDRTSQTNAELARAGIEVIRVPGAELRSPRGGPRSLATPINRDPTD